MEIERINQHFLNDCFFLSYNFRSVNKAVKKDFASIWWKSGIAAKAGFSKIMRLKRITVNSFKFELECWWNLSSIYFHLQREAITKSAQLWTNFYWLYASIKSKKANPQKKAVRLKLRYRIQKTAWHQCCTFAADMGRFWQISEWVQNMAVFIEAIPAPASIESALI